MPLTIMTLPRLLKISMISMVNIQAMNEIDDAGGQEADWRG